MTANPIGIVILAIVALVAIIVIAYKKSETFRAIVDALWAAMKSGASAVASVVGAAFSAILNAIQTAFGWVKSNWPTILAILTGPIGIAVALIVKNWDKIESAFKAVTDKIDSLWSSTVGALKSAVSGLGALLSAPFDAAKSAVQSLIDLVQGLINKISGIHFPKIPGPLAGLLSVPAPPQSVAVSRSAAPAVPVVGSRAVATGGGITINVTGAIDPEATARQIERVLIGHTRRTGFAT
jgi:phage-related protein